MVFPGKRLTSMLYRQALCAQSVALTAMIDAVSGIAFKAAGIPMHPCVPWAVALAMFGFADAVAFIMDRKEEHRHE